ncbi:MAG: CoA-binding protein [Candidatus Goldbacteria bacterium]|nr:CoA-binding protein [Candidatus Goldiibacteriota bacterium]
MEYTGVNQDLIDDFLSQQTFAVAGSFRDETKYAYQIFRKLRALGKTVYPINPGIPEVDGVKAYPDVGDVKTHIDVVNLVTPPAVSLKIVQKCFELGTKMVWLQPGAESTEILEFCFKNNVKVLHNVCIIMELSKGVNKQ